MFDNLSNRLDGIVKRLRGKGRLTEADVDEVMKEIRSALLEADVNVTVVRSVCNRIREHAVGATRSQALDPGQQVVKAVHDELIRILGGETLKIQYASKPPTVILMAGLQGSGKTTASGKLALWFKSQGRNPLLVGADLQRPAAVEQLRTLGRQVDVPVYSDPEDPVLTAFQGVEEAKRLGRDVVIVDTAGRLSIDKEMMEQVRLISGAVSPHYTFLVIDAMTGQDAVQTAEAFHHTLQITGVILSKLDGDARGGAALSVKEVIGRPIAFASTGEKLDAFEQFHPDRMAGRILGMGDMLTLIEQAERAFEADQAEQAAARLMEGEFTLDDFLEQMQSIKKMGSLSSLLGMMPGMPKVLVAALITFFPMLVNAVTGLRSVDPAALEFMRTLDAPRWRVFWSLRVPSSLPYVLAALRISVPLCLIGAVVAEWMSGDTGVGQLILIYNGEFNTPGLFAAVFVLAIVGVSMTAVVAYIERRVLFWHESSSGM